MSGPIGGVIKMIGSGVGVVAEYHEHRKEQKLSRENSRQDVETVAGSSNTEHHQPTRALSSLSDPPPSYSSAAGAAHDRLLASGKPATEDKKATLAQHDGEGDVNTDDDDINSVEDEEEWRLDELNRSESGRLPSYEDSEKDYGNTDKLVRDVMDKKAPLTESPKQQPFVHQPLPCPVIIPQRRPRNKTRGFVHAYAPLLGECSGIDQDTFLAFLENFYKSSQASPVFGIIQLSAAIAGVAPEPIIFAVTTAVQVAARVGEEVQTRYRTNDFLDKMNNELFKPAGLYAMIVKYKSDAEIQASGNSLLALFGAASATVDVNTNQTIAKYDRMISSESTGSHSSMTDRLQNIRLASGTTKGSINLPAAAPLIFPHVDNAIAQEGPETFKDKAKDASGFLQDYMDRRAQLKYAQEDPNSALMIPESERTFKSKLADPNHPMFNKGIIGFVSGGYLGSDRGNYNRHDRREQRRLDVYDRRMDSGRDLTRKQQRRYDMYMAEREAEYGRGGYGGQGGYGYGNGNQRHRHHGPIGLVVGAVGAAAGAVSGGNRRHESEDSSGNHPAPPAEYGKRSVDDQQSEYNEKVAHPQLENAPADHAPYSGNNAYYGGRNAYYGGSNSYYGGRPPYPRRGGGGGAIGAVKRMMREDVLYLMIVNMPSEAEMADAREKLARAKSGH